MFLMFTAVLICCRLTSTEPRIVMSCHLLHLILLLQTCLGEKELVFSHLVFTCDNKHNVVMYNCVITIHYTIVITVYLCYSSYSYLPLCFCSLTLS